ncbi:MAG: molybdenum cofactor biosynthesis protein MoaE [Streptomycetaceae bacterium]|jgi:molybdopterin synthase catalytic subunit|nr:MAG: molybdenum cofactor biosynthesis protein MoaE [Streptomycetaceae bacterium]
MAQVVSAVVTSEVVNITDLAALVKDDSCGAVVTFIGDVRNHDGGKDVHVLTYEIHPSAGQEIIRIAQEASNTFDVVKVAVAHRYGQIPIGQTAFAVAVSAHHRESAFEACQALVNTVKAELPIWKHQVFTDGSDEWVNTA